MTVSDINNDVKRNNSVVLKTLLRRTNLLLVGSEALRREGRRG